MGDFGYTDVGASFGWGQNQIMGCPYTCPQNGKATHIKVYTHAREGETGVKCKCAIYDSSYNLVGYTEEISLSTVAGWRTLKFVLGGTLEAGKKYYLTWWTNKDAYLYWDAGPEVWQVQYLAYAAFPDPLVPTVTRTRKMSIYCTYTPSVVPTVKGTVNIYAVVDSEEVEASFKVNQQGPYTTPYSTELTPGTYTFLGSYKGQTATKTVTITAEANPDIILHFPSIHTVTITSEPSLVPFTLNGEPKSTPLTLELPSGPYTIVMPFRVMVNLDEYVFEQWENGSRKPTRTVTLASPQEVNLVATYRLRQIDEAGPINQRQAKDTLQEVFGQGADLSDENPLPVKDLDALTQLVNVITALRGNHDVTLRLHGNNLALDNDPTEVFTTSPTVMAANVWTQMFHFLFEPLKAGNILWVEIYLRYRVRATTVTADVDERVRARNKNGTYILISDALATANIGTDWIERVTSGYILPVTNFNSVPLELQVQMRTNEADTARLEISSLSYIRVVYKEV